MDFEEPSGRRILSVGELNRLARQALESQLPLLWVGGEISNLTLAASGHIYFTLKDANAAVRGVMFRSRAQSLDWRPQNGDRVEAQALVTLYEPRGDYQLNVEAMRRAGAGPLYEKFLRLKEKLEREGLFAPEKKRALPAFPRRIGVITSPHGAALRDVVTTLGRRAPQVSLILYPSTVQGAAAPREIIAAIEAANGRVAIDRIELLILCRGGGSLEDIWAFNDEDVARAVRASLLPIVCGVGHETDFTIADFAADLRAPTPSAAAEMAAPERSRLLGSLLDMQRSLSRSARRRVGDARQRIDLAARRLKHPAELLEQQRDHLTALATRLGHALRHRVAGKRLGLAALAESVGRRRPDLRFLAQGLCHLRETHSAAASLEIARHRTRIDRLADRLTALNPGAVLARGYSLTTDVQGRIIRSAAEVELGAQITVHLADGRLAARIEDKNILSSLPNN